MIADSTQWPTDVWTKYYRELLVYLNGKLRCPQEAEDVAQDTFLRLLSVDNPTTIRQPRAFLYRVARNLVVDSSRKRTVRARHMVDMVDLEDHSSDKAAPDHMAEGEQLYQVLREAIGAMPPRRRQVFVLYRFGQVTQADIARQLGISTSMVERHLMKAMDDCRARMQPFI
ncbi:MAG: RNA polymerase sigma factor [Nitrospirales bacterium]